MKMNPDHVIIESVDGNIMHVQCDSRGTGKDWPLKLHHDSNDWKFDAQEVITFNDKSWVSGRARYTKIRACKCDFRTRTLGDGCDVCCEVDIS